MARRGVLASQLGKSVALETSQVVRLFGDREALAEARRLIEKHGYGRRLEELADAEAALGS